MSGRFPARAGWIGRLAAVVCLAAAASAAVAQTAETARRAVIGGLGAQTAGPATVVVAVRSIPPRTVISEADLAVAGAKLPTGLEEIGKVAGMEARVMLYAGRPISPRDLSAPAAVERNDIVTLVYDRGGLLISAEGRALDRGAPGDAIRAMNLGSRQTVTGRVAGPGRVDVAR